MNLNASKRTAALTQKPRNIAIVLAILVVGVVGGPDGSQTQSSTPAASPVPQGRRKKATPVPTPIALPPDVKIPNYTPGAFPFHEGERLVYQASWLGIPAARGWFELHRNKKDPSLWNVEAWIETNQVVDLLFKMRDYMLERVSIDSLKTQNIYQQQRENQRSNEYTITYDKERRLVVSTKKNRKGSETHEFISDDPFGPISGAMMALSQQLTPGTRLVFDVFSGLNRYVFDFSVEKKEQVQVPVGTFNALKIAPGVVYLSNGKLRSQARETYVWISDDQRRLPLRMEAATFIGTIRADLVQIDGPPVK